MINFFGPDRAEDQGLALEAMNLMPPAILMLLFLFLPAINLSGLVSNRMEARRAEMGIRKAFGAKRRTLLGEVAAFQQQGSLPVDDVARAAHQRSQQFAGHHIVGC